MTTTHPHAPPARTRHSDRMTTDEIRALPATVDVATAARALGFGRSLAYDLARHGRFPCRVLRAGNRYLIPTTELLRLLGLDTPGG
jgi:Helix-turn-helix domain